MLPGSTSLPCVLTRQSALRPLRTNFATSELSNLQANLVSSSVVFLNCCCFSLILTPLPSVHKPVAFEEATGTTRRLSALWLGSSQFNTGPGPRPGVTARCQNQQAAGYRGKLPQAVPVPDSSQTCLATSEPLLPAG